MVRQDVYQLLYDGTEYKIYWKRGQDGKGLSWFASRLKPDGVFTHAKFNRKSYEIISGLNNPAAAAARLDSMIDARARREFTISSND